jgi:hypothetical protein
VAGQQITYGTVYPTAGTGGGGSGGATPTTPLTAEVIDLTDGSWTLYDPDGLIDQTYGTGGAAFNATTGYTTIKMAGLAIGDAKYMIAASNNGHHWPRWYRAIEAGDNLKTSVMSTELVNDPSVTPWARSICLGICNAPTSTDPNTLDGTGGFMRHGGSPSNAIQYGVWMLSSQTSGSNLSNSRGVATILRSRDSLGSGAFITSRDDTGRAIAAGTRNSNFNAGIGPGDAVPTYHILGVGTYGTGGIVAGSLVQMRFAQTTTLIEFGD